MIYLGIGSNLGDRLATMTAAVASLEKHGVELLAASPLFETPAWGGSAEGPFLNAVLEVGFLGSAPALLDLLLEVEDALGRVREKHWGNRNIDLDLLEFHREVWDHPRLRLPHPDYPQRAFVVAPFAAFRPSFIPTGLDRTLEECLQGLSLEGITLLGSWDSLGQRDSVTPA